MWVKLGAGLLPRLWVFFLQVFSEVINREFGHSDIYRWQQTVIILLWSNQIFHFVGLRRDLIIYLLRSMFTRTYIAKLKALPAHKRVPFVFFNQPTKFERPAQQPHSKDCACQACKGYTKLLGKLERLSAGKDGR